MGDRRPISSSNRSMPYRNELGSSQRPHTANVAHRLQTCRHLSQLLPYDFLGALSISTSLVEASSRMQTLDIPILCLSTPPLPRLAHLPAESYRSKQPPCRPHSESGRGNAISQLCASHWLRKLTSSAASRKSARSWNRELNAVW